MSGNADSIECHVRKLVDEISKEKGYKSYDFKVTEKFNKGENYLGNIQRATLEGVRQNNEKDTLKLLVKTSPAELYENGIPLDKYYANEIFIYKEYFPVLSKMQNDAKIPENLRMKFAKCFVSSARNRYEALIFEDLNSQGYKMYDRMKSLDRDHAVILIKTQATYHALAFAMKAHLPKQQYERFKNQHATEDEMNDEYFKYSRDISMRLIDFIDSDEIKAKFKKFCDSDMKKETYDYLDLHKGEDETRHNIIIHADSWMNNFLFKYENDNVTDMIILDWQTIKFASPIVDVIYSLYLCLDEKTRDELWDELLDTYYSTLSSRLIDLKCDPEKCYPKSIYKKQLKEKMGFALVICAVMLPFMLNRKEDAVDMKDLMDDSNEFDASLLKISDECITRFNGALRHLLKTNVI